MILFEIFWVISSLERSRIATPAFLISVLTTNPNIRICAAGIPNRMISVDSLKICRTLSYKSKESFHSLIGSLILNLLIYFFISCTLCWSRNLYKTLPPTLPHIVSWDFPCVEGNNLSFIHYGYPVQYSAHPYSVLLQKQLFRCCRLIYHLQNWRG